MFHLIKIYFKSCQLANIILPTDTEMNTCTETTVLIEFNCGKERLIADLCTIQYRLNEVSVNCNLQINGLSLQKYCLHNMVEIDKIHYNFKIFHNDSQQELSKYVYIPFYYKLKICKWENKDWMMRLLIGDKIFEQICVSSQNLNYIRLWT